MSPASAITLSLGSLIPYTSRLSIKMEIDIDNEFSKDDVIFYSVLYSTVSVAFAMAVLSKFLTNEFRFGFRSILSLVALFLGEPLCQFLVKGPTGLVIFTCSCLFIYSILPASHLSADKKWVLITGCDSGFGHALSLELDHFGMNVIAGCLEVNGPGAVGLRHKGSSRLHVVQLDVTKSKEIEAVTDYVKNQVKEDGLWGLVNNAGVWCFADLEMTSEKVLRKLMDVNLFGAVRVTQSVLPLIKHAKGRVVNVSSLLGRVSMECCGAYGMSKHALVAYSDTLRLEMRQWGVSVSLVEPTGFLTGNMQEHVLRRTKEEVWNSLNYDIQQMYGKQYIDSAYTHIMASAQKYPTDLTPVTSCIQSALLSVRPRLRYPCGTGAELLICIYPLLPVWVADMISNSLSMLPRTIRPQALSS